MPTLFDFQEEAISELLGGRHIIVATMGMGKNPMSMVWAARKCKETGKDKVLVVTTASKAKTCFVAGTKVLTSSGEKNIEDISVGEKVLSYRDGEVCLDKVVDAIKQKTDRTLYRVDFGGCCNIIGTEDHPFYVGNGEYKEMKELRKGDVIYGIYEKNSRGAKKAQRGDVEVLQGKPQSSMFSMPKANTRADESSARPMVEEGDANLFERMRFIGKEDEQEKSLQEEDGDIISQRSAMFDVRETNNLRGNGEKSKNNLLQNRESILLYGVCKESPNISFVESEKEHDSCTENRTGKDKSKSLRRKEYTHERKTVPNTKTCRRGVGICSRLRKYLCSDRRGIPRKEDRDRDRRVSSWEQKATESRHTKGREIIPVRVDDIQVLGKGASGKNTVYCIEVEKAHNFFANGVLVHNCDHLDDLNSFCPGVEKSLSSFSVISWHKLRKWVDAHKLADIDNYVYVFDECLPADTLVKTNIGEKEIASLSVGDKVLSYSHDTHKLEYKKITRTIKKPSPNKMIRLLLSNGTTIISTGNHPHFTQDGYKNAEDIKIGDKLYEARTVCETKSSRRKSRQVWGVCKVQNLWKKHKCSDSHEISKRQTKAREAYLLLDRMWKGGSKREWEKSDGKQGVKRETTKNGDEKDDREQLFQGQEIYRESVGDQKEKRMATDMGRTPRIKRWQRKIYRATKTIVGKAKPSKQGLDDGTACATRKMDGRIPKELQVGHWKCILQDRGRMRWQQPQFGKDKSERQEEGKEIRGVRVERVEVLQLGDIKRLGLYRDADNVYCIDVEDNHNFFANGILTHNCQRAGAGVSSGMGRAFLSITKKTSDWSGWTGTPGDTWLKFYPYLQACGLVKHKTAFMNRYASVQTYKGYPEIIGWRNEDELRDMWARISYAPDTRRALQELPKETHRVITFSKPKGYQNVLKTRLNADGEFLDTAGALCAELRRLCFTKDKKEWVKDFVDGLESGCVFFYNFIKTGDELEEIITKALPKSARVWRIDGKHHDIPTPETIGQRDMVLCQWQSGSEALNLQFLHYWCSVEACYSYSTSVQARGRIKRIGQEYPMSFFYLKTEGTIEDDVYKALKNKSDFAQDEWCASNNIIEKGGQ